MSSLAITLRFDWTASPEKYAGLAGPEPAYHGLNFSETFGDMAFTMQTHAVGLRDLGASMAPMNAFLTLLGTETLPLRMQRHVENALEVARFLENDDRVAWVSYAGLPSSSYHERAKKYLPAGAGSALFGTPSPTTLKLYDSGTGMSGSGVPM